MTFYGDKVELHAGESIKLTCEFKCLEAKHVAQLWKNRGYEGGVCLVNATSIQPSVALVLHISSVTKADSGFYSCTFQPSDTISQISIEIVEGSRLNASASAPDPGNFTTSDLTTASMPLCNSAQLNTSTAGESSQPLRGHTDSPASYHMPYIKHAHSHFMIACHGMIYYHFTI
ncbi:hypothetical protein L3Q82_006307 [Scomber scombrus]|uniref:Ig-like domain-containing protein n=1 Tax=Scomber scombrus TaxID=13677 RepID=A0AAV1PFZ3_SCOSC